jgi:hypothetical protein
LLDIGKRAEKAAIGSLKNPFILKVRVAPG